MPIATGNVFALFRPEKQAVPLVLDSPHSGQIYPEDFRFSCPKRWLTELEDRFVDEIFRDGAQQIHAPLLSALVSRCYIDLNRSPDDIDPLLMEDGWNPPAGDAATEDCDRRAHLGAGLIRRFSRPGSPIYSRSLTTQEVQTRLEAVYRPYHRELQNLLNSTRARFGLVLHLNCHSAPESMVRDNGNPDIVLGDRNGTSADPQWRKLLQELFRDAGFSVAINAPFKGLELTGRYSNPADHRHSLQIEINRRLYMHETTLEKSPDYPAFTAAISQILQKLAGSLQDQTTGRRLNPD